MSNLRVKYHLEVTDLMNQLIAQGDGDQIYCIPMDAILSNISAPSAKSKHNGYKITLNVPIEAGKRLMEFGQLLCGLKAESGPGWLVSGIYLMPAKNEMEAI